MKITRLEELTQSCVVQGNRQDELSERLLGSVRMSGTDLARYMCLDTNTGQIHPPVVPTPPEHTRKMSRLLTRARTTSSAPTTS